MYRVPFTEYVELDRLEQNNHMYVYVCVCVYAAFLVGALSFIIITMLHHHQQHHTG